MEIKIGEDEIGQLNGLSKAVENITGKPAGEKITEPGVYNLNGAQATAYARIRYTEGGDYKRAERMRTVMERAFAKVKSMDLVTLNKVIDTILPKVQTNINVNEIVSLATQMTNYKIINSEGWPYKTKGITLDLWYGIPITLETNVQELHHNLFNQTNYEVPETIKNISNKIIEKTGYTE